MSKKKKKVDVPKTASRGARKFFDVPKTRAHTEIRAEWEILGTITTNHLDSDYTRPHLGPQLGAPLRGALNYEQYYVVFSTLT